MVSNLADRERSAKLEVIRQGLKDGLTAEELLKDLEQVEIDFWNKYEEAREQSRD